MARNIPREWMSYTYRHMKRMLFMTCQNDGNNTISMTLDIAMHSNLRSVGDVCCYLHHSNSILVISWHGYDVWDEKKKAWAYTFTNSMIYNLQHHICMVWKMLAFDDTVGKWIAAELNATAVMGFVSQFPGSPTQRLNQQRYLPILHCGGQNDVGSQIQYRAIHCRHWVVQTLRIQ